MKDKLLTVKELREQLWWWKRNEHRAELERIKLLGYELAARNYELMRRSENAGEFQQNYLHLDRESKTATALAWGNPNELPNRQVFDLRTQEETGWTSVCPHLQWNLRLSKRALTAAFLEYINQQQKKQNVFSNSSLKGKPGNRPKSWLYIEYLDMRRNNITGYDCGMASKAEKLAAQFLSEFKITMAKKDEMVKKLGFYNCFDQVSEGFDDQYDIIGETPIET